VIFVRIGEGWAYICYGLKRYQVYTSLLKSMIQGVYFLLTDKYPPNLPSETLPALRLTSPLG